MPLTQSAVQPALRTEMAKSAQVLAQPTMQQAESILGDLRMSERGRALMQVYRMPEWRGLSTLQKREILRTHKSQTVTDLKEKVREAAGRTN